MNHTFHKPDNYKTNSYYLKKISQTPKVQSDSKILQPNEVAYSFDDVSVKN